MNHTESAEISVAPTRVETYSSYAYAVAPRAFEYQKARHAINEILRLWKSPGKMHFYIRDEHARFFELTFDEAREEWNCRAFGESCSVVR